MDENNKPDSWLNDLSELIQRKKEENELLKKLQATIKIAEEDSDHVPGTQAEVGKGSNEKSQF